jgi:hypothetical protein
MRNFLITLFALATFTLTALADPPLNESQFHDGLLTNTPTVLTNNQTATINAVILTGPGHGVALFPLLVATNASTSNFVVSVSFARDRSLTNWSSPAKTFTNSLAGTTAVAPLVYVSKDDCDGVCAIRVNSLQSLDSAFTTTVSGIGYSARW